MTATPAAGPFVGIPEGEPPVADEVHVWAASLSQPDGIVDKLRDLLDPDERARADRFTFEKGRRQATIGRGLLRLILARYQACPPNALRFRYTPHGKPELVERPGLPPLKFNLSHSGALVLYALARDRDVGVDLESVRPEVASEGIAERFFAPAERDALRALPPESRTRAFFTCWTRKEAYIKAKGQGLSIPLDRFVVSLDSGPLARILATLDDPDEAGRWSLHELDPGPGYVGALAVAGPPARVRFAPWPVADVR